MFLSANNRRPALPMKLTVVLPFIAVGACLLGCSPGGVSVTGTECSGDLGSFLVQCITNRGGRASPSGLPAVRARWTHQFRSNQDIILVPGDCYSQVQSFLRQAYGDPDSGKVSGQHRWYGPKQIGVALNLTEDSKKQTIICILGQYGSVASPPNPSGGANGWQPVSSGTNSTSAAAATHRSP